MFNCSSFNVFKKPDINNIEKDIGNGGTSDLVVPITSFADL